jgi:hypothetical protein
MAYSDFITIAKVRESFNLTVEEALNLFADILEVLPSSYLQTTLNENVSLATAINTEKARMVPTQLFNQRNGEQIKSIYGAVTTGTDWKFLQLIDSTISIDKRDYFINEVSQILGILRMPFKDFYAI